MTKTSLESEVRDYYQSVSLADDRVDAILDVTTVATTTRRWRRIAIATSAGLVAMTLLAVGLYLNGTGQTNKTRVTEARLRPDKQNARDQPNSGSPSAEQLEEATERYRLVAFRSHGDECPHCRATGEVFRELATALCDESIEFEQFDLSQLAKSSEMDARLETLHLTSLIAGRMETAFLALVDLDGKNIREFKPSMKSDRIANIVRDLVTE